MRNEIQKWVPYVPLAADVAIYKSGLIDFTSMPFWLPLALLPIAAAPTIPRFNLANKNSPPGEVDNYRADIEYPPFPWLRIFAPLLAFATDDIGHALPLHVPPIAIAIFAFVVITACVTYSFNQVDQVALRQGARRARMLASKGLEGVTASRIGVVEQHLKLCQTLVRHNWFDGIRAQFALVAHKLDSSPADVRAAATELEKAGLARVSTIMHSDDPDRWWVELTELGVRTLAAQQRR
ncbi:hypothetical protein QVA66_09065 [Staphylococcus chromogenes]|nr:hypothetical protein [Staphylococcus chromogenes]